MLLKSGLRVIRGHWRWHHSINRSRNVENHVYEKISQCIREGLPGLRVAERLIEPVRSTRLQTSLTVFNFQNYTKRLHAQFVVFPWVDSTEL